MAIITKTQTNYYKAHWTTFGGKQKSKMTTCREFQRALKQANEFEAVDHFHDQADAKVFDFMAQNGLSPDDCHNNFTHKAHIRKDKFKQLLNEVGVKFLPSKELKNKTQKRQGRGRRMRWKKRLLTLEEIMQLEGCILNYTTVKARVDRGMSVEDAISEPVKN